MFKAMVEKLRSAHSVVLSTHRQCDGDGLGAQLALLHGLGKLGKLARIINVDLPPRKYGFLNTDQLVEIFVPGKTKLEQTDLALILDTNDGRLLEPLFSELSKSANQTLFIDHHPILSVGPAPSEGSLIDTRAASTGELCYYILKELGVEFDANIARALYTSIVFDTQLFRYMKSNAGSHRIAAELLTFEKSPEEIHRHLFATYTVDKMRFLINALDAVEYLCDDRIAFVPLRTVILPQEELRWDRDESGDVIDQVMNITSVEVAALLREDAPGVFKLSFRSKGAAEVLSLAESFGGGGHRYASGAYVNGVYEELRERVVQGLNKLLNEASVLEKKPKSARKLNR